MNYDCSALVDDLYVQAERLRMGAGVDYEIIVGDDASTDVVTVNSNKEACSRPRCRFVSNAVNYGRAKNRNAMAELSKGDLLLIIDCDAKVCRQDFLARYIEAAKGNDVVCGGIVAPNSLPSPDVTLRYKYERNARKVRSLEYRVANPYRHFSTFNVLIRRDVFMEIMFDEKCVEYGYEDALFGLRLKQRGIHVEHIDNPLVHVGMDTNESFVNKCEQAMRTLKRHVGMDTNESFVNKCEQAMRTLKRLDADMKEYSHVGSMAMKLKRFRLIWAVKAWHFLFRKLELANLLGKRPSLFVLKAYKLGYFCYIGGAE